MIRRSPRYTRTYTLCPFTPRVRSGVKALELIRVASQIARREENRGPGRGVDAVLDVRMSFKPDDDVGDFGRQCRLAGEANPVALELEDHRLRVRKEIGRAHV